MADLQKLLSDGEIVEIFLGDITEEERVLVKKEIEAFINAKLGNYTFDGNEMSVNGTNIFEVDGNNILLKSIPSGNVYSAMLLGDVGISFLYSSGSDLFVLKISEDGIELLDQSNALIDAGGNFMALTKGWALENLTTPADVDGKFGNYSFDGDFFYNAEKIVFLSALSQLVINPNKQYVQVTINADDIILGTTIAQIDASLDGSAVTKEWTLAKFFQQSQFIQTFNGQSGVPVKTSPTGKLDPSLITNSVGELQGNWTPTAGTEYPDLTGKISGDYWVIEGVGGAGNGYEFLTGQLSGTTIYDNAWMQLDTNLNWVVLFNSGGDIIQWGGIGGNWADQTDNANMVNSKADQTALNTTNTNVSTNATNISTNANAITDLQGKIAAFQADSNAPSIGVLVQDFNSLLAKLKDAGLMETS